MLVDNDLFKQFKLFLNIGQSVLILTQTINKFYEKIYSNFLLLFSFGINAKTLAAKPLQSKTTVDMDVLAEAVK